MESKADRNAKIEKFPQFRSHKIVRAIQISDTGFDHVYFNGGVRFNFSDPDTHLYVGRDWILKHQPEKGGYLVVYEDGYMSFSPKGAFELGYKKVKQHGFTQRDEGCLDRYEQIMQMLLEHMPHGPWGYASEGVRLLIVRDKENRKLKPEADELRKRNQRQYQMIEELEKQVEASNTVIKDLKERNANQEKALIERDKKIQELGQEADSFYCEDDEACYPIRKKLTQALGGRYLTWGFGEILTQVALLKSRKDKATTDLLLLQQKIQRVKGDVKVKLDHAFPGDL